MRYLITLKPQEPYFFGTDRNVAYGSTTIQRAQMNPYYIKSANIPSQSALFGVLRYLGIADPKMDFSLSPEDKLNIGEKSFSLLKREQTFGRIRRISPLFLMDNQSRKYVPAPLNHAAKSMSKPEDHHEIAKAAFEPYDKFSAIKQPIGCTTERYLPMQHDDKNWDDGMFVRIDDQKPVLIGHLFTTQTRVGINRDAKKKGKEAEQSGFFKKDYIQLHPDFSFAFYADLEDEMSLPEQRMVCIGKGRTGFLAEAKPAEQDDVSWEKLKTVFPEKAVLDDHSCTLHYLYVQSDLWYSGDWQRLKESCCLMLANISEYRAFTTNYDKNVSMTQRYKKEQTLLRMIGAGAVFVCSSAGQREELIKMLESSENFEHGQTAGYNCYRSY
ncbi:MAG: hypothetical protein IJ496_07975 [Ruminococcus sp.]|nr:hypothetical protein [Ruminococcus sp.]